MKKKTAEPQMSIHPTSVIPFSSLCLHSREICLLCCDVKNRANSIKNNPSMKLYDFNNNFFINYSQKITQLL